MSWQMACVGGRETERGNRREKMYSSKVLMISGHCMVKGLSGVLMSCDTPPSFPSPKKIYLVLFICHPLSHTYYLLFDSLSLLISFNSSSWCLNGSRDCESLKEFQQ